MNLVRLPGAWVLEAFQRSGVSIEALTQTMPDEVDNLLYHPDSITPDYVNSLLIKCAELSNDPDFGLMMNERVDLTMYGVFGYLLLNSYTVEDLLSYIDRYYAILNTGGPSFSVNTHGGMVKLHFGVAHPGEIDTRHQTEWSLGFMPYYLKPLLGEIGIPISTYFRHSAPGNLQKLKSVFGHNLHFNQIENKIVYPESILKCVLSDSSPSLLSILRQEADELLQSRLDSDSLDKTVRLLLLENLEHHKANASDIANLLNMTLSTFKRKLVQEKIDFRKMKESVKNERAKKLLVSTEASLFIIAKKTGFSDQGSFSRFFVRCNKIAPQAFRKKYLKEVERDASL